MLYKIAAHKSRADQLREEAERANTYYIPVLGRWINTIDYGGRTKHPVVGALLGPAGVAGAVAKDKGVSLYGPTIKGQAKSGAVEGAIIGGLGGLGTGLTLSRLGGGSAGRVAALTGIGALSGALSGAIAGPALGTVQYGLGYLLGDTPSKK